MPGKSGDATKLNIYKKIRSEIITGKKKPGDRLSVDQLKKEFGTSVTPVRDALQMLSQEDLIVIKPRSGYFITRITLKELNDMLDMREILEQAATGIAALKITDYQIRQLEMIHQGYTDDKDDTYSRYIEENHRFHSMIAKASGNDELARLVSRTHDRLSRFMIIVRSGKHMIDIHQKLIDRLKAHDPIGAKKALQKELDEARSAIMDRIMREEAGSWHLE